ncbi:short-chain dehydrogenase/reductase SDR [Catenulispora acidiphila DSM 44928]|uniref:Short-chain dehydrogenase/reductase SDR n=1 Tax=Catenulispora acidiphila (strain DSM 44928 / JCM 14897 / NBRC 102108 / NRRL B-24433 / ID139908) TaxID=479433 RepID=C7Q247_CATAD|nr:glucose 1-dehydrogenase [Catenulispora acidiphila]ACU77584.1 short-chain dehydrogenase/reductase SDR [Catenulispora acidiphila DSM 44928]
MGKLDGRVVLITGAARGQGAEEARLFAAEGANVVVADVLEDLGAQVAKEIGDAARFVRLDVTDEAQWTAAADLAAAEFGKLDGLINNAGILRFNRLEKTSLEEYMQVVAVNQVGVFLGLHVCLPRIRAAGGGTVVNTASIDGLAGMAYLGSYVSTKFAVRGLTRVAALEAAPTVRVNCICPGGVHTPMVTDLLPSDSDPDAGYSGIPLKRVGTATEIAKAALFLTCDDSSYCTGADFVLDGGALAGIRFD